MNICNQKNAHTWVWDAPPSWAMEHERRTNTDTRRTSVMAISHHSLSLILLPVIHAHRFQEHWKSHMQIIDCARHDPSSHCCMAGPQIEKLVSVFWSLICFTLASWLSNLSAWDANLHRSLFWHSSSLVQSTKNNPSMPWFTKLLLRCERYGSSTLQPMLLLPYLWRSVCW